MENNNPDKEPPKNENDERIENLSGDELLKKIERDALEDHHAAHSEEPGEGKEDQEGNELLRKLGLSKKDKLKKESNDLKQKVEELNDKYLRLYAEFDNYKKRTIKERMELSKTAGSDIISALLPIVDDFSRAIKQTETSKDVNALQEGVKLIYQKLISILQSKGLRQMQSIGQPFNPELHDAITEVPAEDESMKGKVVDEIESGYYLNDKIIRHAKVIVGK
jgi:molecular chaperone GrpE